MNARHAAVLALVLLASSMLPTGCTDPYLMRRRPIFQPVLPMAQRVFQTSDVGLVLQACAWTFSEYGIVTVDMDLSEGTVHANDPNGYRETGGLIFYGMNYGITVEPAGDTAVLVSLRVGSPYGHDDRSPDYYATYFDALGKQLRLEPEPVAEPVEPAPE